MTKVVGDRLCDLTEEEEILARKLRSFCNPHPLNNEKRSKLCESTIILYRMGCVYLRKAAVTADMDQKLNFIKAATLLHAARVRCEEIVKDKWLERNIIGTLNELQDLLMKRFSETSFSSLLEVSRKVLLNLDEARIRVKKHLGALKILKELNEDEFESEKEQKISEVKKLLEFCSKFFKETMSNIAEDCLKVCGQPPCKFSVVGLGSLARGEVTLYSDFEHVIILEDGIQESEDYEEALEYFRWFSVLFHVIVIGIGETIIPSIGIESLNDSYSEDKSKNWFYDSFTPSGVSFDGMMPHACKIPLGRQRTTDKKKHIVELIKPVSQMAKYLTSDENMINGYNLKDVLTEICLVFGSEELFDDFCVSCDDILEQVVEINAGTSSTANEIRTNKIKFGKKVTIPNLKEIDPKIQFYRPLSLLIGFASRKQGVGGNSGFDKLKDSPFCGDSTPLEWAFAVACEIRMKSYETNFSSRARVSYEVFEYVGPECFLNCASAIRILMRLNGYHVANTDMYYSLEYLQRSAFKYCSSSFVNVSSSMLTILDEKEYSPQYISESSTEYQINVAEYFILLSENMSDKEASSCLLTRAEEILLNSNSNSENPAMLVLLSRIYQNQGQHKESKEVADCAFNKFQEVALMHESVYFCSTHGMGHYEVIQHYRNLLPKISDTDAQLLCIVRLIREHLKFKEVTEARQMTEKKLRLLYPKEKFTDTEIDVDVYYSDTDESWEDEIKLKNKASDLLYKIRSSQISSAQHFMPHDDFIAYCEKGFCDNDDCVSKLLFGKASVETQCKQEIKARRLLKELVTSCSVNIFGTDIWLKCLYDAAAIQYRNMWLKDFLETWEIIDDAMASGRVFLDMECLFILMDQAIRSYIILFRKRGIATEKMELIEKAIQICHRSGNLENFHVHYCSIVETIIGICGEDGFRRFKISKFHKIMSEAPRHVREENVIKMSLFKTLVRLFADHMITRNDITTLEICHYMEYSWLVMKQPHPFLYPFMAVYRDRAYKRLEAGDSSVCMSCRCRCRNFAVKVNDLWRSLFSSSHARRNTISNLLVLVYNKLGVNVYQRFNSRMAALVDQLPPDQDFKKAVTDYLRLEYDSTIKKFWRIINRERKNSHLQRFSMIFLYNVVLHFMWRNFGYTFCPDYSRTQFFVGTERIVTGLEENQRRLSTDEQRNMSNKIFAAIRKRKADILCNASYNGTTMYYQDGAPCSSTRRWYVPVNTDELASFRSFPPAMAKRIIRKIAEEANINEGVKDAKVPRMEEDKA